MATQQMRQSYATTLRKLPFQLTKWSPYALLKINGSTVLQIKNYLGRLYDSMSHDSPVVLLPSVNEVSKRFGCDTEEVYGALNELKKQGFNYKVYGEQKPIKMFDALYKD